MKRFIIPAVAAFGLAVATPAVASTGTGASPHGARPSLQLAQRDRDRDRDQRKPTLQPPQQSQQQTPQRGRIMQPAPQPKAAPRRMRQPKRTQQPQRFDWNQYQQRQTPPALKRYRSFDLHRWQRNFRAQERHHWQPYQRPQGWYFQRWMFGMVLPTFFWTRQYWIENYWEFGLPDPPYGYVWVRYGDDALLVNVRSGYILQTVYDLFE